MNPYRNEDFPEVPPGAICAATIVGLLTFVAVVSVVIWGAIRFVLHFT